MSPLESFALHAKRQGVLTLSISTYCKTVNESFLKNTYSLLHFVTLYLKKTCLTFR